MTILLAALARFRHRFDAHGRLAAAGSGGSRVLGMGRGTPVRTMPDALSRDTLAVLVLIVEVAKGLAAVVVGLAIGGEAAGLAAGIGRRSRGTSTTSGSNSRVEEASASAAAWSWVSGPPPFPSSC